MEAGVAVALVAQLAVCCGVGLYGYRILHALNSMNTGKSKLTTKIKRSTIAFAALLLLQSVMNVITVTNPASQETITMLYTLIELTGFAFLLHVFYAKSKAKKTGSSRTKGSAHSSRGSSKASRTRASGTSVNPRASKHKKRAQRVKSSNGTVVPQSIEPETPRPAPGKKKHTTLTHNLTHKPLHMASLRPGDGEEAIGPIAITSVPTLLSKKKKRVPHGGKAEEVAPVEVA